MPERDGYIPGVPCWVDTSQPDPEAAVDVLRRPVRLGVRGRDAAGVARQVLHRPDPRRRRRRGRLACPRARRRWRCGTPTSGSTAPTRPPRRSATPAATSLMEPFDVMDAGPDGGVRRSRGRRRSASGRPNEHKGARVVNEHGSLNFNGLNTRDPEGAKAFYGAVFGWETARPRRRRPDVDAARLRRPPRGAQPGHARADGRDAARPSGFEDVVAAHQPDPRRPARHPGALERDVRGRRRRRDRRARRPSSAAR